MRNAKIGIKKIYFRTKNNQLMPLFKGTYPDTFWLLKHRAVIQSGILLLIATPLARVLFSLLGFVIEKDWVYVAITLIVLTILALSLFIL
jgi:uncharacterized membrane protein